MNSKAILTSLALLATACISVSGHAGEQPARLRLNAAASVEQDSNLALVELDTDAGQADTATVLQAGAKLSLPVGQPWMLRGTYDYTDTSYREFSGFDLGLHHVGLEAAVTSRLADAALAADRFEGILDNDHYLTLTRVSPVLSRLFVSRLFVRGAYIASRKEFDFLPARNADGRALRLDTYLLLDGMDRYLSLGVQKTVEDAIDPELDYEATAYALSYGQKFRMPLMQLDLKARLRFEERDYLDITQSIGAIRRDRRWQASLNAALPLADWVKLEGSVARSDNRSNLGNANIDKQVYRLGLALQF